MSGAAGHVIAELFGHLPDGREVALYTLEWPGGLRVSITEYGGAITSLCVPDRGGAMVDVVLGYDTLARYIAGKSFFGGIIGRFGNRIARGRFASEGIEYSLPANDGPNHLHGGPGGFHRALWKAERTAGAEGPAVKFARISPDNEEGYPGNLRVEVSYTLKGNDTLQIDYRAQTDKPTPVNLTNHSYFNLAGHDAGTILNHELTIFANHFTPVDATLIPTGELRLVAGTPLDFREPHSIGKRLAAADDQLRYAGGYDHNFVLSRRTEAGLELAARVREPRSGRVLEVLTTEPGLQFYSGNFLDGSEIGKGGIAYPHRTGFCLETQHFPDSPNQPNFPGSILRPGSVYESSTLYRFSSRSAGHSG